MKKITVIFIAFIMSLTFIVPTGTLYAEPNNQINSEWSKLSKEISESPASGSKTKIDIDRTITSDAENDKTIIVKAGQNIILKGDNDINGIGIESIKVEKGATLTIDGPRFLNAGFNIEGELILNSGQIKGNKFEGPTIFVNAGEFTMNGGEISGNKALESQAPQMPGLKNEGYYKYSPITVYDGAFTLNGGKISQNEGFLRGGAIGVWGTEESKAKVVFAGGDVTENTAVHKKWYAWGGSLYMENCDFEMSDGSISKSTAEYGGGIAAIKSDITFTGGKIVENDNGEYKGNGGGLLAKDANIDIKNIDVSKNKASGNGGGMYLSNSKYTIDKGEFNDNSALNSGGAISFVGTSSGVINAGIFKNNESNGFWGGGAIYNDTRSKLVINRALIKDNKIVRDKTYMIGAGNHPPSRQGGGVWNCPTGNTEIYITNGLALYENSAPNAKNSTQNNGAGDDFANITKYEFGKPVRSSSVELASRMLGGGKRLWYQDGSFYGIHTNLSGNEQKPRYNPDSNVEPIKCNKLIKEEIGAQLVYKSVPTADSKKLAEQVATSIFTGNKALGTGISGGGITNNGELEFGEDTPYTLIIKKSWTGDRKKDRPKEIKLKMYIGENYVEDITLKEEENWTKEIKDFPDPDTLIDNQTGKLLPINFQEKDSNKYVLSVLSREKDKGEKTYTIQLNNSIITSVKVTKKWKDDNDKDKIRPDKVTVALLANGKDTGKELVLTKESNWKGEFTKLPVYENDEKIIYQVKEKNIQSGYKVKIQGNQDDGFTIINTHTHKPPKTGDNSRNTLHIIFLLGLICSLISFIKAYKKQR